MLCHLIHALRYSCSGLKLAYKQETAFRLEVYLCLILIPLAFYVAKTKIELILLICSWLLVLIIELINTAIEAVIDRIGSEAHFFAKVAKDVASAAVFLTVLQSLLVWLVCILF